MIAQKPIFKIGKYSVFREGNKFAVRDANCDICEGSCRVTALSASKSDIKKIMSGKLSRINDYDIILYPKTIKIGCTRVRKSKLERLLK